MIINYLLPNFNLSTYYTNLYPINWYKYRYGIFCLYNYIIELSIKNCNINSYYNNNILSIYFFISLDNKFRINIKKLKYLYKYNLIVFNISFKFFNPNISINYLITFIKESIIYNKSIKLIISTMYFNLLKIKTFSGLKIIIKGRLNKSTRSSMLKSIKGTLNLTSKLISCTYKETIIITKYGIVGIKIWVAFKNTI